MNTLSQEILNLNTRFLQDNQRILQILTSLDKKNTYSSTNLVKVIKENFKKQKTPSIVTNSSKKIKQKSKNILNCSVRTIKRISSPSPKEIIRCPSCKIIKNNSHKNISGKLMTESTSQKSLKRQTSIMKIKKLSQKIIPKVPNKLIYSKKSTITHINHGSK